MPDTLEVLNGSGHLTLTWNPDDPVDVARAREMVTHLKSQGYTFFVVAGSVGDDTVEQGAGRIIVDRIDDPTVPPPTTVLPNTTLPEVRETPKATPPKGKGRRHVAVRQMAGG